MRNEINSVLNEFLTVREYAEAHDRCNQWAYNLIAMGLPVLKTGKRGGMKIHVPAANKWLLSRMVSRRKPKKVA